MEKIFNFSDFSSLYEAEGETKESKAYEQNLKIVVSDLLGLYYEMADYGAYTDAEIDSDLQKIIDGNSLQDKIEVFKSIFSRAKQKALPIYKIDGSKELIAMIDSAYNKYLEALSYIVGKYKTSQEESALMIDFIEKEIEEYKAFLNEGDSKFSEYSQIFEGKKSLLSDAQNAINILRGKIDSYKTDEDPRKKKFATDADLEIIQLSNVIKGLKDKKNRDIEKSEIKDVFEDILALEIRFDKGINKIIDENTTDAELERLRNKARDVKDQIIPLRNKYIVNKSLAEDKEKSEKIKVKLGTDYIDYVPDETNTPNQEVKKFQELVVDAFNNIKSVTDLPFYKKMGTSGKYGPNTRDMIKFLKTGFGLQDKSGDITKELVDEIQIQRDTIKESVSSKVYDFSSFVNISEAAFDLAAGLEFAKTLPTYKSEKTVAKKSETPTSKEDEKSPYGWKPSKEKEDEKSPYGWKPSKEKEAPKVANLTADELQEAYALIKKGFVGDDPTDEKSLEKGILMVKTVDDIKNLDNKIKEKNSAKTSGYKDYLSLEKILQGELGFRDLPTVKNIANHLNKINGVKMTYTKNGSNSVYGDTIKISY
jgi:hypothetical protein